MEGKFNIFNCFISGDPALTAAIGNDESDLDEEQIQYLPGISDGAESQAGADTVARSGGGLGNWNYGYKARLSARAVHANGECAGIRGSTEIMYKLTYSAVRLRKMHGPLKVEPDAHGRYVYSSEHVEQLTMATGSRMRDGLPRAGDTFNFNGILRRLGQSLAYYTSPQGDCDDPSWILGGRGLVISEAKAGRTYRASGMYIQTHGTDGRADSDTMGVIAHAAAATGAPVFASELYVAGNNWATRLPTGSALCEAIHRAAQLLIDSAGMSGGGVAALFSYTTGMHDVVSVNAHTDEGGFARDVMRSIPIEPAKGAVAGQPRQLVQMPVPSMNVGINIGTFVLIVHRMVLATAALFAVADPGVAENSAIPATCLKAPGSDWQDHEPAINLFVNKWINSYSLRLASGAGMAWDDDQSISRMFSAGMAELFGERENCRHLEPDVIHPCFWIEPTPILRDTDDTVQFSIVCPMLGKRDGGTNELPMWGEKAVGEQYGDRYELAMQWDSFRNLGAWYVYSPNSNALDGLSQCRVQHSMGHERTTDLRGMRSSLISPGIAAAGQAGSLLELAWTLGSSGVPPPAMAYPMSASYVKFDFNTSDYEHDQHIATPASRFRATADMSVRLRVSGLVPQVTASLASTDRDFTGVRGTLQAYALLNT